MEVISKQVGVELVIGDYPRGIMAIVYDHFIKNNKKVIAILKEKTNSLSNEDVYVEQTSMKNQKIYEMSDLFLFLPGGIETYGMIFTFIEENMNQSKPKKIILYNRDYFFTPMIKELYHLYQEGLIKKAPSEYIIIESENNKIIEMIKEER